MFVHVDPSNGIAIYDQIVRQVKFAVASEALKPGNLVPSVREMARDLTVNPNTVASRIASCRSTTCCNRSAAPGWKSRPKRSRSAVRTGRPSSGLGCGACSRKRGRAD